MTETLLLVLACLAGCLIGILFFGGLWWTLRRALWSRVPAPWFIGSLLVRMTLALAGFYLVSDHRWERSLACLMGFIVARLMVMRCTRPANQPTFLQEEGSHAPYSR
jgi:F1F0 ATPase subunit 2